MSRSKYENVQSDLCRFIPEACLFLSLLSIAEDAIADFNLDRKFDMIDVYRKALDEGWLGRTDNMLYNQCALLEYCTGKPWIRSIVPVEQFDSYEVLPHQYTISKWVKGKITHFRRRGYDVYANSNTVKNGRQESVYVYTMVM